MAENTVNDVLITPADCKKASKLISPFIKQLLEKQIIIGNMSRGNANAIYAAHVQLYKLSEKMVAANVGMDELHEWLENAREIRTGVVEPRIENK